MPENDGWQYDDPANPTIRWRRVGKSIVYQIIEESEDPLTGEVVQKWKTISEEADERPKEPAGNSIVDLVDPADGKRYNYIVDKYGNRIEKIGPADPEEEDTLSDIHVNKKSGKAYGLSKKGKLTPMPEFDEEPQADAPDQLVVNKKTGKAFLLLKSGKLQPKPELDEGPEEERRAKPQYEYNEATRKAFRWDEKAGKLIEVPELSDYSYQPGPEDAYTQGSRKWWEGQMDRYTRQLAEDEARSAAGIARTSRRETTRLPGTDGKVHIVTIDGDQNIVKDWGPDPEAEDETEMPNLTRSASGKMMRWDAKTGKFVEVLELNDKDAEPRGVTLAGLPTGPGPVRRQAAPATPAPAAPTPAATAPASPVQWNVVGNQPVPQQRMNRDYLYNPSTRQYDWKPQPQDLQPALGTTEEAKARDLAFRNSRPDLFGPNGINYQPPQKPAYNPIYGLARGGIVFGGGRPVTLSVGGRPVAQAGEAGPELITQPRQDMAVVSPLRPPSPQMAPSPREVMPTPTPYQPPAWSPPQTPYQPPQGANTGIGGMLPPESAQEQTRLYGFPMPPLAPDPMAQQAMDTFRLGRLATQILAASKSTSRKAPKRRRWA